MNLSPPPHPTHPDPRLTWPSLSGTHLLKVSPDASSVDGHEDVSDAKTRAQNGVEIVVRQRSEPGYRRLRPWMVGGVCIGTL